MTFKLSPNLVDQIKQFCDENHLSYNICDYGEINNGTYTKHLKTYDDELNVGLEVSITPFFNDLNFRFCNITGSIVNKWLGTRSVSKSITSFSTDTLKRSFRSVTKNIILTLPEVEPVITIKDCSHLLGEREGLWS